MLKNIAAVILWVMCAATWVYGGALEPPAGGSFSGGTVTQPVVFTGDNSGGTGTVRIRPSDEDTQLVLCDASNNASPEVCSNWQHYNQSANAAGSFFATNLYIDSASTLACANGAVGSGYFQTYASNTQGQAVIGMRHPGSACSSASLVLSCITTGGTTATCTWGSGHTTTTDFRGPILNGGSATCNSVNAGSVCLNDTMMIYGGSGVPYLYIQPTANNLSSGVSLMNSSGTGVGGLLHYGSGAAIMPNTVIVSKAGVQFSVADTTDIAATSVFRNDVEDFDGTPIIHGGVYGDGADYKVSVTPTALSGAVDNYAGCTKARCRLDPNGAHRDITGLTQGADGKVLTLCNIATGFNLVLKDSVTSTAANQFSLDADFTILPERCQEVVYDGTSSRWRLNN